MVSRRHFLQVAMASLVVVEAVAQTKTDTITLAIEGMT